MYNTAYRIAEIISKSLAIAGGAVLLILVILNVISIMGRALVPLDIGIRSIRGIYDITEIGMAAAIFAFLPLAQFNDSHAKVDLFAGFFSPKINLILELVFNIAMLVVAAIGTHRLFLGGQDKYSYSETTLIAQIPVWYGYAAGFIGAAGFVIVAGFCVWRSVKRITHPNFESTSS